MMTGSVMVGEYKQFNTHTEHTHTHAHTNTNTHRHSLHTHTHAIHKLTHSVEDTPHTQPHTLIHVGLLTVNTCYNIPSNLVIQSHTNTHTPRHRIHILCHGDDGASFLLPLSLSPRLSCSLHCFSLYPTSTCTSSTATLSLLYLP